MPKAPEILECTLRDGSYAIDFQFSADDTFRIAKRLDELGFPLIEVGHGIGLGASEKKMGTAAATDEEYMTAAAKAVTRGRWGMFCIPGIARLSDLYLAADHGIGFVRIGTEVNDVEGAQPFIEAARTRGLQVFSNLMKSYTSSPAYFASQAKRCVEYGAQCIYIVDSAGGMLPTEIATYIDALRDVDSAVRIGFHGHNNIGMAVANALFCAERGVDVIDTSLQGLGRSAGNTQSEHFIATLIRSGYELNYDVVEVMQAGEELIRPLVRETGYSSLDITAGLALFHSSYMKRVLAAAKDHRVDPRRLILALCSRDRVNAPIALIEEAAREVRDLHAPMSALLVKQYFGEEQV
jgi:4-hydroxy 2-oxovalerate aldolase